jgi:hypothetical protein
MASKLWGCLMILEIIKEKDADQKDVFLVSRKQPGRTMGFDTETGTGKYYSDWTAVEEGLRDLKLPRRSLEAMRSMVEQAGFAEANLPHIWLMLPDDAAIYACQ